MGAGLGGVSGVTDNTAVEALLGHTQIKTTQRYAHRSHDTLLGCHQLGEYDAGGDACADGVGNACGFTGLVGHFGITLPQRYPSQRNC